MRKLIVAILIVFTAGIIFTSCASTRGPKCPGMYSEAQVENQQKPL